MDKRAKTNYSILSLLEERWSIRAFRDEDIDTEKIARIFEAARWAPSAYNEQPWRYIIGIKNIGNTHEKICSGLKESNSIWACNAPVLVVCCAKKQFSHNLQDNFHFLYDCGQSVANMTIQAMHEGVYVHQMAGFYFEKIVGNFNIPKDYYVATIIAMGYPGNPEQLPESLQKAEVSERNRKPFEEFLFTEEFGKSFH